MTSPQVRLDPMTEAEFQAYFAHIVAKYAASNVTSGNWTAEEAAARSAEKLAQLLPDGLATDDTRLCLARDAVSGERVGIFWLHLRPHGTQTAAFVHDIEIDAGLRGRGYGRAVMLAGADLARELGAVRIGLHVFAHNETAIALYTSLGFATTDLVMSLPL
ncbi:GNAT family N-acetyltransferase [Kitasatospora sp. NPDC091335]|uniref:GNAT family N-acetyltransferase n=1 Tax=Kitasatospora sp. NPDC091335 TaxID=3364085 RepID=UPI003813136F